MQDHIPLEKSIIYGPIPSRRLGQSLGINLLSTKTKICDFNCLYCFFGPTSVKYSKSDASWCTTASDVVCEELKSYLQNLKKRNKRIDYITFSGNGEPTLHPAFPKIVDDVIKVRNDFNPNIPICIFSNGSTLGDLEVINAIMKLDKRIIKLDTANPKIFAQLNRPPKSVTIESIIENLKKLKHFTIQTAVTKGKVNFLEPNNFQKWITIVRELRAEEIQIYNISYPTADSGLERVAPYDLRVLAAKIESITQIPVYYFN